MVRRASILLTALSISLIVYLVALHGIFQRLVRTCGMGASTPGAQRVPAGFVDVFGFMVPVSSVIAGLCTIPAILIIADLADRWRRHRRYLNDDCIECGRPITSWRGRCRGCGMRIGPG